MHVLRMPSDLLKVSARSIRYSGCLANWPEINLSELRNQFSGEIATRRHLSPGPPRPYGSNSGYISATTFGSHGLTCGDVLVWYLNFMIASISCLFKVRDSLYVVISDARFTGMPLSVLVDRLSLACMTKQKLVRRRLGG